MDFTCPHSVKSSVEEEVSKTKDCPQSSNTELCGGGAQVANIAWVKGESVVCYVKSVRVHRCVSFGMAGVMLSKAITQPWNQDYVNDLVHGCKLNHKTKCPKIYINNSNNSGYWYSEQVHHAVTLMALQHGLMVESFPQNITSLGAVVF